MGRESEYIHKSHNVSVIMYHFVCPAKYRRVVFSEAVDIGLKEICEEIEKRYDFRFLEIGTDKDHVHFLIQSVPKLNANHPHSKKYNGERNICAISRSEKEAMGWRILD